MKKSIFFVIAIITVAFLSCEEIVLEDDISNAQVNLVAPVNNAQFFSTGITFTWDPIENGSKYRIQIARPDFANALQIVTDNVVDTTSFTTQLNVGRYEWRVQAVNSGYTTAFTTRSFTVVSNEDFQSNSVALSSPSDNKISNAAIQNLTWQPIIGATGYHVQIVNSLGTITHEQDVNNTLLNYTFSDGSYQWRVRATNGEQNTMYSSRTILIDTTPPNTPVLTAPANLTNTASNDVSFQWSKSAIAGSIEKDSIYIYRNNTLTNLQYKNQQTSPYASSALPDGTYYWFVKSFDEAGNISQQSTVFSFTLN